MEPELPDLPQFPEPLVLDGHWRDHSHKVSGFTVWQMRQYARSYGLQCYRMGVEAERERAAELCEQMAARFRYDEPDDPSSFVTADECAAAIRGTDPT